MICNELGHVENQMSFCKASFVRFAMLNSQYKLIGQLFSYLIHKIVNTKAEDEI